MQYNSFVADYMIRDSAYFGLQTCLQAIIDVGGHIVVCSLGLGLPETYYEVPEWLADYGMLSEDKAKTFEAFITLRNKLVHAVGADLKEEVYEVITNDMDKARDLMSDLVSILEKQGTNK